MAYKACLELTRPPRRRGRLPAGLAAGLLLVASTLCAPAGGADYRPAQVALFATPHLDNVERPQTLRYALERRGEAVPPLQDAVEVVVEEIAEDGSKNLSFRYLHGAAARDFPPLQGFRGNPLVMLFLQYDVERLAAATGGSELYFRNRIREAFADAARVAVEPAQLPSGEAPARLVTLRPFLEDPMIDRFPGHRERTYRFLLSDAVPGGLFRLGVVLPGAAGGAPVFEETLTFREAVP